MKTRIHTDKAPAAIGPYSQAVLAGDFLYVSGQLPLDPVSGAMAGDTAAEQAEQSIRNLSAILEAAGMPSTLRARSCPPAQPSPCATCPRAPRWRSSLWPTRAEIGGKTR